ncbi:MAG: hypothetical protein ACOYYS_12645 [Chloroflexota bacterium]
MDFNSSTLTWVLVIIGNGLVFLIKYVVKRNGYETHFLINLLDQRHVWAYGILKLACSCFPKAEAVETALEFAEYPEKWGYGKDGRAHDAHRIVDAVNPRGDTPIIFQLATQVGKVVYTAQQYPAPFDHGAGWEIAAVLKQIVLSRNDSEFEKLAWATLANRDFISLEKLVACHPGCPICISKVVP